MEYEAYKKPQSDKEYDIVQAAEGIFAEFGYAGATTSQLAKNAGVTERTLFKYFPTKSHLYRRVLAGLLFSTILPDHMSDLKNRIQSRETSFKFWFISILSARYEAISKQPNKLRLLLGAILFSQEFSEIFGKLWKSNLYEPSIAAVRIFQESGELRKDLKAEQITRASYNLAASFLITKLVLAPKYPMNVSDEISGLFEIFYHGVKTEPSRSP